MARNTKTAKEAIVEIMHSVGVSQQKLAEKIGLKKQQSFYNILNAKNGMRLDSFIKILDALGYEVIIRNRVNDEETQIVLKDSGDEE